MPFAEDHVETISGRPHILDWILRHDAAIIFHLYLELIVRHDPLAQLQDLGERARGQPVIRVLANMSLEDHAFALPDQSTAIDEVLHDMADLGHVSVERNGIALRQDKMRE